MTIFCSRNCAQASHHQENDDIGRSDVRARQQNDGNDVSGDSEDQMTFWRRLLKQVVEANEENGLNEECRIFQVIENRITVVHKVAETDGPPETNYPLRQISGQSYKHFTLVNYDSRLVITSKLIIPMNLE